MPLPAAPTPSTTMATSVSSETPISTAPVMEQPAVDPSALPMAPHDLPLSCPIDVPLLSFEDAFLRVDPVVELILSIPSLPTEQDATSPTPGALAMPPSPLEPTMFVDIEQGLPAFASMILTPTPPAEVTLLIPSLSDSPPAHASASGPAFGSPASTAHEDVGPTNADVEAYGITSPTTRSTCESYHFYDMGDMGMCEQTSGVSQGLEIPTSGPSDESMDASTDADLWTKGAYVTALMSWPSVVNEGSPRGRCDEDQACCATLAEILFPSLSSKQTAVAVLSEPTADHTSTTPAFKPEACNGFEIDSAPLSSVVDVSCGDGATADEHRDDAAMRAPLLLLLAPPALKPEACDNLETTRYATVQPVVDVSSHDAAPADEAHTGDDAPPAPVLLLPAPPSIDPEAASDAVVSEGMSMNTVDRDGQGMEQQRQGGSAEPPTVEPLGLASRSMGGGDDMGQGPSMEIITEEVEGFSESKGLGRMWRTIVHGARFMAERASATVQGLETADGEWRDSKRARMEAFLEDALGFE